MRFPTGSEVTRLRSDEKNFSKVYLGIQRGKERGDFASGTLMVGQHYQISAVDGYVSAEHLLFLGNASLNGTDIRPNMTLLCGTRDEPALYGSVRIRSIGLGAAPTGDDGFYLEPNDLRTNGHLQPGDYIWVDGVYRLYRKLPNIVAGVVYEDGNGDTLLACGAGNQIPGCGIVFNVNYLDRPVALMGSPRFAFAGESIDFYGWRSHGRGGHGIQNWTWNFDGGICTGPGIGYPGSPGSPVHAKWMAAGEYIASLVIEDDSGKAGNDAYGVPFTRHRAVRPVLVYDRPGEGDNPPYTEFEVESLTGKYGSGWSAKITVYGTADKSEFPDNALVIIYAEDWYGGEKGSMGGWYGQEGILFCGYIRADSVEVDFEKSSVSFEAQTIEKWMQDISLWPMNCVSDAGVPTQWHHFQAMTVEDVLWYLTELRSNLKDVTDCFFASDVNAEKTLGFVDLTEASLYNQMSEQLGSCLFGRLSASRHGSVHLFKQKNMMDLIERLWWGPPVFAFDKQDWRDEIQIGEERQRDSVAQVDFIGFVYDNVGNPLEVYSLAPARQTNFGTIEKVTGVLLSGNSIAAGQAENNTLAGLYLAWKNIRFPHIKVPARNNRFLECATLDYFAVNLEPEDTLRGYDWPGKEFLCTGVSYHIDNEKGIIWVDYEGEASTWGPDGVAGIYPVAPPSANPPGNNPPEYWPDWPPGATPDDPDGDPPDWSEPGADDPIMVFLALDTGEVIRGVNVGYGYGYTCEYYNLGQVDSDGLYWMALDKHDPINTALVCTPYRIYKTTNLNDDTPTWTQVFPAGGAAWPSGEMSMVRCSEVQKDLWMAVGFSTTQIYIWWSTKGGDLGTWNQRIINSPGGDADGAFPFLELSTHDADRAWITFVDNTTNITYIAKTTDMWATVPSFTFIPTICFNGAPTTRPCSHHRRYDNGDDSADIFGGTEVSAAPHDARIYFGTDCAALYNDGVAYWNVRVQMVGCGIGTEDRWWALAYGQTNNGFWVSDDGVSWTEQRTWPIAVDGLSWYLRDAKNLRASWQGYAVARDGASYPVTISIDRGESWSPQFGDWPAVVTDEGLGDPNVACICSPALLP